MATESKIVQVLDLLTTSTEAHVESLAAEKKGHAMNMRSLINQKNIIAVGISEKISNERRTGKLALTFYVEKKVDLKKLRADQAIPPTIAESISGTTAIPTDVVVIGKLRLEANPLFTNKPLQPGFSIGHKDITAGTFGAVVTDGKDLYILSNSHVLAKSGKGKKGDAIIYPGKFDGGKLPKDVVAILHDFAAFTPGGDFVNHVDCAIAKPTEAGLAILQAEITQLGLPKGTTKAVRGMKIVKVGRTTGKTIGEVKDVHFRTQLNYEFGVGKIGFMEQVFCTRYSEGGDSGSLILDSATMRAVGLHFAGAEGGSVFNPIDKVLESLKVTLVTKALALKGAIPQAARKSPSKKPSNNPSKGTSKVISKEISKGMSQAPSKGISKIQSKNPSNAAKKIAVKKKAVKKPAVIARKAKKV